MRCKKILNKKADMSARKMIFYGIFSFLAVIAFLIMFLWVTPSQASEISKIPEGLENYLLIQRFLNSPLCFVFQDKDTNRVYPWIIDLEKFDQNNIEKCYNAENTDVKAYRLTLNYNNEKRDIKTKNWEGFLKKAETQQVFVYDKGKIQLAELLIEMQDVK